MKQRFLWTIKTTFVSYLFVLLLLQFFVDLIERTWRAYSREPEFKMLQQIECAIQELLLRVVDKSAECRILDRLSDACRKDILPLKSTKLAFNKDPKCTAQSPVVNNVTSFSEWLQQCFVLGANRVSLFDV